MINIQRATEFENYVVEHILKKEKPNYIKHLTYLGVEKREYTDRGFYLHFRYLDYPTLSTIHNFELGISTFAEIKGLEHGASFILYIDAGKIMMLESFCYDPELWPTQITKFRINDLDEINL